MIYEIFLINIKNVIWKITLKKDRDFIFTWDLADLDSTPQYGRQFLLITPTTCDDEKDKNWSANHIQLNSFDLQKGAIFKEKVNLFLLKVWNKETSWVTHEELDLRPTNFSWQCYITKLQWWGRPLQGSYVTLEALCILLWYAILQATCICVNRVKKWQPV